MRTVHLSRAALEPWAILPGALTVVLEVVTRHFAGEKLDAAEVQARIHGGERPEERMLSAVSGQLSAAGAQGSMAGPVVAVLPVFGTIFPRANLFTDVSGATSAEMLGKRFDQLVQDPNVGAIVLDVDSPGGQAPGVAELSAKIFEARGTKPILAVANHMMASAAYWIGTSADEVAVTPSGEVGSIGVFAMHEDMSKALEQEGVTVSLISAGKFKTEGNPYEPLSQEARDAIQASVGEIYDQFVAAVARNRGVKAAEVRAGFGEGRVVSASEAVRLGMADRVATLDETIARAFKMMKRSAVGGQRSAEEFRREPLTSGEGEMVNVAGQAGGEPEPVAEDEEIIRLRNYVDVFGRKGV